jgi:multimeric flavodoxin WrbA
MRKRKNLIRHKCRLLGVCGSRTGRKSISYDLLRRALKAATEMGADTETYVLSEKFDAKEMIGKLREVDGLIVATPVHWFNMSALTKTFIDEAFWDFSDEPYELDGKPVGIIAICEEDGGNQAIASITLPLNHCGMFVPPFGTLFHNSSMPGHGERRWQNKPQIIGEQVAVYAERRHVKRRKRRRRPRASGVGRQPRRSLINC